MMEEKKEKKFHEKWWFAIVAIIFLFVIAPLINGDDSEDKEKVKTETVAKDKEEPKEENNEEVNFKEESEDNEEIADDPIDNKLIELDNELLFGEFKINMKSVKLYEEDGKDLAEVKYTWTNQAGDGKKYLFALTTNDVFQGDEVLTETTGAADIENKKTNSFHEHNGEGGTVNIRLVYELIDKETPITLRFNPLNEFGEDSQEVIIDID